MSVFGGAWRGGGRLERAWGQSFSFYLSTDGYSLSLPVRTALIAIIGFMPTKGEGAIGSLDYTPEERRALAKKYDVLKVSVNR